MPELPEVWTVVESLKPLIIGKELKVIHHSSYELGNIKTSELAKILNQKKVVDIRQRGKYIALILKNISHYNHTSTLNLDNFSIQNNLKSGDGSWDLKEDEIQLLFHLRMTGKLTIHEPQQKDLIHTHLKFQILPTENTLNFSDVRRFGGWQISQNSSEFPKGFKNLGPEPLSDLFSEYFLFEKAKQKKETPFKTFLLNQEIIAGLGNIYADEISAILKVAPNEKLKYLNSLSFWKTCKEEIQKVLRLAILNRGTSFKDYVDGSNKKGSHQNHLLVYGKKNKPCPFCNNTLSHIKIGGRGTTYCIKCQKNSESA